MSTLLASITINLRKSQERSRLRPAPPWVGDDLGEEARMARLEAAAEDFWTFDATYFPPSVYTQGYAPPADYHRHLIQEASKPGVYVHLGARDHGKTVTMKKYLAWRLLYAKTRSAGTYSATLRTAKIILRDVKRLISENPRIRYDFRPRFVIDNTDEVVFTTEAEGTEAAWRFLSAFSEKRSVRGDSKDLARPEYILCDDLENRESPMGEEQVRLRGKKLAETRTSMAREGTTLVCLGNDFDERCLMHRLRVEHEEGLLDPSWRVERHAAWSDDSDHGCGAPLWPERFPAATLDELRALLRPADEDEWQGDYLQNPQPPAGNVFQRETAQGQSCYVEYDALPDDARGVIYTDPNLSLKGKGDTTAITALLFSPSTQDFYVPAARCRSFSTPEDLLDAVYAIRQELGRRIVAIGQDGNVSQESTWTNFVRLWSRERGTPFPPVVWCRYRVDDVAKNCATHWGQRRILFPKGFSKSEEGTRYLNQIYAFKGKRSPSQAKDDAPDSLICADELLHERGIARTRGAAVAAPVTLRSNIDF